jgi:glycosyltransferase involved in cell wall biosynthesis
MALRVLTQINYSAGENAEGDSGLRFTAALLRKLVQADPELHFYVLIPEKHVATWTEAAAGPGITLIPFPLAPRLHGGDFQFDPAALYERFDFRKYDVDVLFLNQPETAPAFLQFFNRQTFHNVPAVSYVHWFDTRRPSTPKQKMHLPALLANLSGMMVSAFVGCNSEYGRDAILLHAARWFHPDVVETLRARIRILPPAVDSSQLRPKMKKPPGRRAQIIVNHRLLKYTGVRTLLAEVFPRLWARRKDFRVIVTNPSRVRLPGTITAAPWMRQQMLAWPDYVRLLWESDIVVAPHRSTHWSISTLEAICADCIPLMNTESFFPEMFEPILQALTSEERQHIEERWFYFRGNVVNRLSNLIDNIDRERVLAKRTGREARRIYDWSGCVESWLRVFREADRQIPAIDERNPSMRRIAGLLAQSGAVEKATILKELGWSPKQRALSWTSFRKRLRMIAPDDGANAEAVFRLGKRRAARKPARRY